MIVPDQVGAMVERALEAFGRIDILCNNAGIGSTTDVVACEPEEWDRVMTVNVKSVYLGCKYTIPHLLKQGRGASYGEGVPRDRVTQALTDLRARLDQFRMAADADLAALLQQELGGALDRYAQMKARSGALDFLDLLLIARNLVRDNRQVREGFQRRFARIFRK